MSNKNTTPQEDFNDLMELYTVAGEPVHGIWYIKPDEDDRWAYNGLRGDLLVNRGYTPKDFYMLEDKVRACLGELSIFAGDIENASPDDLIM